MCCKRYHIIFSTFPLNFKCKICVLKDVIPNFKNHIWVTWPAMNLLILKKLCGFEKPNHYYFFLRYDPLIVFRGQNHITFIFIKTMSHDLLVQMAYQFQKSLTALFQAPLHYSSWTNAEWSDEQQPDTIIRLIIVFKLMYMPLVHVFHVFLI